MPREVRVLLFRRDRLDARFASPRWRESREPVALDSIETSLGAIDRATDRVILCGGSPLEHPDFDAVLAKAAALGFKALALETDAAPLADRTRLDSLVARGISELFVYVGGASAEVHEHVLATPGSFAAHLDGLRNVAAAGVRHHIVIPLARRNAGEAAPLARRLVDEGGWACKSVVLGPGEPSGVPKFAFAELLGPREIAHVAAPIFRLCEDAGIGYGFLYGRSPLACASFDVLEPFGAVFHERPPHREKAGEKFSRIDACSTCAVQPTCPGVESLHVEAFGTADLKPVPPAAREAWKPRVGRRLDAETVLADYKRDGYVMLRGAIPPNLLAAVRSAFDRLMAEQIAAAPDALLHVVKRVVMKDPIFLDLVDLPTVYPLPRALIGRDITLAHGGVAYHKRPHSRAYLSWHNDFNWLPDFPYPRPEWWVRGLYFIEDIDEQTAPMAVLPGTHLATHACPPEYTAPDGQPRELPGMVRLTGKAGDVVVFNTELWHTNTSNTGDHARKFVMLTYKHAWMRQWTADHEITPEFAESQKAHPLRWQLCGGGIWHRQDGVWQA